MAKVELAIFDGEICPLNKTEEEEDDGSIIISDEIQDQKAKENGFTGVLAVILLLIWYFFLCLFVYFSFSFHFTTMSKKSHFSLPPVISLNPEKQVSQKVAFCRMIFLTRFQSRT